VRIDARFGQVEQHFEEIERTPRRDELVVVLGLRFQALGGRAAAWIVGKAENLRVLERIRNPSYLQIFFCLRFVKSQIDTTVREDSLLIIYLSFGVFPHPVDVLDGKCVLEALLERLHNLLQRELVAHKELRMIELPDHVLPVQGRTQVGHGQHEHVQIPGVRVVLVALHPVRVGQVHLALDGALRADHHREYASDCGRVERLGQILRRAYAQETTAALFLAIFL
jgi:hypothetical protein